MEEFIRTQMLLGQEAMDILKNKKIAVFGVGGVGGYVVEALVRSGIGAIDIIDNDIVSVSNINRQIIALHSNIGRLKTEVMAERIKDINPDCVVREFRCFYLPETSSDFDFSEYDYVVDAVDTVTAKISLVMECQKAGTPIISSMGTGNKLDPTRLEITDIYKTSVCPLARVMRKELKNRGVKYLKVLYSNEIPIKPDIPMQDISKVSLGKVAGKKGFPGSTAFVPPAGGLIIASHIIRELIEK